MAHFSPEFTDQRHLTEISYKTSEKLDARKLIHHRYTRPQVDFIRWVLATVPWRGDETVIDVGCGSGGYLELARAYGRFTIACDLSPGMLQGLAFPGLDRVNLDAQHLPFDDNSADVILANHMIYHIPDKNAALAEIARVLRPGGSLIAATNSEMTMPELRRLPALALERLGAPPVHFYARVDGGFSLENGRALLQPHFNQITRHDLRTALVFPKSQPVLDYINSSRDWHESKLPAGLKWETLLCTIEEIVEEAIGRQREFRVQKLSGTFVCRHE